LVLGLLAFILSYSHAIVVEESSESEEDLGRQLVVRIAFEAYDKNKDGKLSISELVRYAVEEQERNVPMSERSTVAEIREGVIGALPNWDTDGNGSISFKELLQIN